MLSLNKPKLDNLANEIWKSAERLRGKFKAYEYQNVILPIIVIRRLECVLIQWRKKMREEVLAKRPALEAKAAELDRLVKKLEISQAHFSNTTAHTLESLAEEDPMLLEDNFRAYLNGFSRNVRDILDHFNYHATVTQLVKNNRLAPILNQYKGLVLGPDQLSNLEMGYIYEELLRRFSEQSGEEAGEHFTPREVIRLMVELLDIPTPTRHTAIYDPACGSGGMFVQSEKFVESHGGRLGDISIYGQESNATTRRLAVMNLALRGIEADFGSEHADTFRRDLHPDLHPDLRADYVLANPPFNDSDWFRKDDDVRWQFGVPPKGNANFAWVQHFIHHLAPQGMAGFVLANGSMSSNQSGEGDIRRALIEADLVDCMVALPGQLFYSTQIPVCLWFLTKSKAARKVKQPGGGIADCIRDRREETLFIDARKLGTLIDRVHRELTDADLDKITSTYHAWRGNAGSRGGAENAEEKKTSASESLRASASPRELFQIALRAACRAFL